MKETGMLMTCDRCGYREFVVTTGTKELDGGYTTFNEFAPPKQPWGTFDMSPEADGNHVYDSRDLCPSCLKEKDAAKKKFWNATPKENPV